MVNDFNLKIGIYINIYTYGWLTGLQWEFLTEDLLESDVATGSGAINQLNGLSNRMSKLQEFLISFGKVTK